MQQTITIIQQKLVGVFDMKEEAINFATTYPNGTHINIVEDWESSVIVK